MFCLGTEVRKAKCPLIEKTLMVGKTEGKRRNRQQRSRDRAVSSLCPHRPSPAPRAWGGHSVCVPSQRPAPAALVPPSHSFDLMLSYLGTLLASPFSSPLPTSFFSWRNYLNLALSWKKTSTLPSLKPLPLMPCLNTSCQRSKSGAHCRPGHFWPLCLT